MKKTTKQQTKTKTITIMNKLSISCEHETLVIKGYSFDVENVYIGSEGISISIKKDADDCRYAFEFAFALTLATDAKLYDYLSEYVLIIPTISVLKGVFAVNVNDVTKV